MYKRDTLESLSFLLPKGMSESTAHAEVEMLDIIKQKINEDRLKWFFQTPELCMLFSHWAAQYETN